MSHPLVRALCGAGLALALLSACSDPAPEPQPTEPPATQEPQTPEETTPEETPESPDEEPAAVLQAHGISAGHPEAVSAGAQILQDGGSAADAIVAAAFAVAVVEPFASGIGGGGSAIVAPHEGEPISYDYREVVGADGVIPPGGAGVPGFVAGMAQVHAEHGVLDWDEVLAPAIALAQDGVPVSEFLALRMSSDRGPEAVEGLDHFAPGGRPLTAGEPLVQTELAETMRTIASEGPAAFYQGDLAPALAPAGVDARSLADYEVVTAEPVRGEFGDYEIVGPAPALPGVGLIQLLQVAQAQGLAGSEPGSPEFVRALGAGWSVAQNSVQQSLGDPAFVDVPVEDLTDADRNASLGGSGGAPGATAGTDSARGPESAGNTTHLTVVDTSGLMISMTNTITSFWGSQQYAGGYFLNDQLTRFEAIGTSSANDPAPGKRSVSWSTPTVVLDGQGRAVLGIGSPGGERIPQLLAQVISRWALHEQSLEDAVLADRFVFEGGELLVEDDPPARWAGELPAYEVIPASWAYFGSVQALAVDYDDGGVIGAVDPRREADVRISAP